MCDTLVIWPIVEYRDWKALNNNKTQVMYGSTEMLFSNDFYKSSRDVLELARRWIVSMKMLNRATNQLYPDYNFNSPILYFVWLPIFIIYNYVYVIIAIYFNFQNVSMSMYTIYYVNNKNSFSTFLHTLQLKHQAKEKISEAGEDSLFAPLEQVSLLSILIFYFKIT